MKVIGEAFNVNKEKRTTQQKFQDSQIDEKYIRGEIRIVTEQARYPLDTISTMLKSGKYDLNPDYQRRKRWDATKQSKLIESFIINVPIPPIFLYEVEFARFEVMDGLQRLTAIDDFYNNRFKLTDLEEWNELNGRTYAELPDRIREGIDRRYLSSIVLLNETAKTQTEAEYLKQLVFGRLNSGGDKLTPQETRNALYGGKFNSFCIKLSKDDNFRSTWSFPLYKYDNNELINERELLNSGDSYRAMEDVELVLRFFAFRHYKKLSSFRSQEKFLDEYLNQANSYSEQTLSELDFIFRESFDLVNRIFGEKAFFMPENSQKKSTPTKTVYDPMMQSISKLLKHKETLLRNAEKIKLSKFKDVEMLKIPNKSRNNDLFDGKYNSKSNIEKRIEYFDNFFKSFLDD